MTLYFINSIMNLRLTKAINNSRRGFILHLHPLKDQNSGGSDVVKNLPTMQDLGLILGWKVLWKGE